MAIPQALSFIARGWPYQAKVLTSFEITSKAMVRKRAGPVTVSVWVNYGDQRPKQPAVGVAVADGGHRLRWTAERMGSRCRSRLGFVVHERFGEASQYE